jgi:hypothetical protein
MIATETAGAGVARTDVCAGNERDVCGVRVQAKPMMLKALARMTQGAIAERPGPTRRFLFRGTPDEIRAASRASLFLL